MHPLISQVQAQTLGQIGEGSILIKPRADGTIDWGAQVSTITNILFFIASVASLVYLIWGAYLIIISSGDQAKLSTGRYKMIYAAIGLILVGGAYAIWRTVLQILGANQLETGL